MFLRILGEEERDTLLALAELIALSDNPILRDEMTSEDIMSRLSSKINLSNVSFQKDEKESELLNEMRREARSVSKAAPYMSIFTSEASARSRVEKSLLEKIDAIPIPKADDPVLRLEAALSVMRDIVAGTRYDNPVVPKLMLFELMLVALRNGNISSIEISLLEQFKAHHDIDDFIFQDLLDSAQAVNREVFKAFSIILE